MKTKLLFLGTIFFLIATTAFYAQKDTKRQKKDETKTEKRQKMHVKQEKEMKQVIITEPQKAIAIPVRKVENWIQIDPLTQELIPPYNPSPGNEITILFPTSSMQYPNSSDFLIQSFMLLQWKATSGHTLEIKTLRENIHGFYGVVQDWTPYVVDEPDGIKDVRIPFSGSPVGHRLLIKLLIRDTAERSKVKTIFLGHE